MHASRDEYREFHRARFGMLQALLEQYVPCRTGRFLDIGGGGDVAEWIPFLRERIAHDLFAVDLEGDVERGRKRTIESVACDVDREPLPFGNDFFDVVLFASVIEHLYAPHRVLAEIQRTLKPGGLLILEAPNAVSLGRRLDAFTGHNPFRWFNQYNAFEGGGRMEYCSVFYTTEEIRMLLEPGFIVLEMQYAMHTPRMNLVKKMVRATCAGVWPRLSDCFAVAAQKRPGGATPHAAPPGMI